MKNIGIGLMRVEIELAALASAVVTAFSVGFLFVASSTVQ
jgi:hypothetical protein